MEQEKTIGKKNKTKRRKKDDEGDNESTKATSSKKKRTTNDCDTEDDESSKSPPSKDKTADNSASEDDETSKSQQSKKKKKNNSDSKGNKAKNSDEELDTEDEGTELVFDKMVDITIKRNAWWITFMTTNGEVNSGTLNQVKTDAKSLNFEKELQEFAAEKGIDLGKAPPKKQRKTKDPKKAALLTKCEYDHTDIGNYKDEQEKKYFSGKLETHYNIKCMTCNKVFSSKDEEDSVVPSAKEPVYLCMGNAKHDCKIGLCFKHYNEMALNDENSKLNNRRRTRRNT